MVAASTQMTSYDAFFGGLAQKKQGVLLLDYDGTIAPFCNDRMRAVPYPAIPDIIESVRSTANTRVVVVSGRRATEVRKLLGMNPSPEIWGVHGLERLNPDCSYQISDFSSHLQDALLEASAWLEEEGLDQYIEFKPGALAVHWRGLDQKVRDEIRARSLRVFTAMKSEYQFFMAEFDGGLELRVPGSNKGTAVRRILEEIQTDVPVAYLGDDFTDEDAFKALRGRALTVLVRKEYRPTSAEVWLTPPTQLIQFLHDWVRVCGGEL